MPLHFFMFVLHAGAYRLSLETPLIMGIVNTTPDSFSDGGACFDAGAAIAHALKLAEDGAAILDVGGESTRPGAQPVPLAEELRRVLPVVEALAGQGLPVSVDTRKPEVMRAALALGAVMINDVSALQVPGALQAVADSDAAVCLMHMQGEPRSMQLSPRYADVVSEVRDFLVQRVRLCTEAGIAHERIVVDPGFGFGKSFEHNLALLGGLGQLRGAGSAVLVGLSRKTMLGALTGRDVQARDYAGVAAHLAAVDRGARILRVHNVAAMRDALAVWNAIRGV